MSLETFKAALAMAKDYDSPVTIGGGEPTLHPEFEHFLILAIAASQEYMRPFIVTNGTHKERSLLILELTEKELVEGHLSYDQYHDMSMVDDVVFNGFRTIPHGLWGDYYGYREGPTLVAVGRARQIDGARKDECACESTFVQPNGVIRQCGCPRSPKIGHVKDGSFDSPAPGCCFKSEEYKEAKEELQAA